MDDGFDINTKGCQGRTVLHAAAPAPGESEMLEYLFWLGKEEIIIEVQDHIGSTPLHPAAMDTCDEVTGTT